MAVTNNFSASTLDLNGQVGLSQPTALVWGPDGRLYITEVDGDVKVLTVAFGDKNPADADPAAQFYVTEAVTVDLIKGAIQNHNDDGAEITAGNRQVTGIDVTAQYDASGAQMFLPDGTPMVTMYVTSSDNRIGGGSTGNDSGLDTNSGVITMMTQTGPDSWTAIDIVRGLPRSEENHATNGLEVIQEFAADGVTLISERMIVASGGNANTGAPSNNFAGQEEQPLSAAILEVDLTMLKTMPVLNDAGRAYIYDLPTLNDPSRPDDANGNDINDPFGGNDSKNSAKLLEDGPISIYSSGYRNAYDVEVTEDGRVWTYDNGANNSWGGRPIGEAGDNGGATDNAQAPGYIATNLNNGEGNSNDDINLINWNPSNQDNFHEVTRSDDLDNRALSVGGNGPVTTFVGPDGLTYVYGGHPNPTRAEGAVAGLLFSPDAGTDNAYLLVSGLDTYTDDDDNRTDFEQVTAWLTAVEANNAAFPSGGIYGAADGALTKKVLAVTPGVLYDIYSFTDGSGAAVVAGGTAPAGGTLQGTSGIPADIAEIVAYRNKVEGDYKEAGKTDGALDTGGGSINGLAEYTSTILDDGVTKMSGAILATQLGSGGNIIVMGRTADGSMSSTVSGGGFAVAADRTVIAAGGGPLGISTVGDDFLERGLTQPFQGSIWTAVYQQNGPLIEIFQPNNGAVPLAGSEIVNPTDRDLDGVDHVADPFEFSDDNGYAIAPGQKIVLDFDPQNTNFPTSIQSTGMLGAALDGTTPNRDAQTALENFPTDQQFDGLYNLGGNILPGGNAPILQIKNVVAGTVVGTANSARDVLHTGVLPSADTDRIVATLSVKNWIPAQSALAEGQLTGMIFGDGTQANFVRVVFGAVDLGTGLEPGLEVGFEIGDENYTVLERIALPALSNVAISLLDLRLTIDKEAGFAVIAEYRLEGETAFTALDLGGFVLPENSVLRDVLTGDHTIGTGAAEATSGAAFGFLAETSAGNALDAIDFNELSIEAFGNEILADTAAEVGGAGSPNIDTVIYTGTDTALAALAPNVENFDGNGSGADYTVTGNALDNLIRVGSGTNTITTGAGADSVRGTLADLDGDVITDFSTDDAVLIEGAMLTNLGTPVFGGAAGSATVTLGGTTITLSGPDLADYDPADGGASINITQGADGVRITLEPALSPVIAISAGGADLLGATVRDQSVDFLSDAAGGGAAQFLTGVVSKSYTNATIAGTDIPDTDLDLIHQTERSAVDTGKWGYAIPVEDGNYLVDLYFAEIFHGVAGGTNAPGSRLFDIFIEDDTVETGVDVLAEAGGPAQELVKTYQATVTDSVLNIEFDATVDQAKLSGLVVWKVGGTFTPPSDTTAPLIDSISLANPQSVQDGTREATIVLTDETGFDAADFAGLDGDELTVTGVALSDKTFGGVTLSNGDKTATLTYVLTAEGGDWPNGTVGEISVAAGTFTDAAGNGNAAAAGGFVLNAILGQLERGVVVRAINVGTTDQAPGTLATDPQESGAVDNNRYGGAIAADTIITDAFGNPIAFEADNNAFYTSPKSNGQLNANVDGQSTGQGSGSNAGGVDLDGSAYHTYRDSNAATWTGTYDGFANGTYIVELHFAELFWSAAGNRIGDFTVNGILIDELDDLDVFAAATNDDTPYVVRVPVTVTDGTVTVEVSSSAGQAGYSAIVVYEAVDPNSPPSLSIGDVTVAEGDLAEITILRSGNLADETSVNVALTFDGAADATDVGALSATTVTFAAGEFSKTITLPITDDENEEGAETLSVTLSNPTGPATLADASATVTIAASDSDLQAPVGATIFELDFETEGEALVTGGFDGALGTSPAVVNETTSEITGGKLVVQTSEGDINDGTDNGSGNDFTRSVDLSDPSLNEIFLTTRFDNPFDQAFFDANGLTGTLVPNFVQQGIVLGTGTQLAGEQVKLVWGGVAGGAQTGVQVWTKGAGAPTQAATLGAMAPGVTTQQVAAIEMSLRIDKAAGTAAQYVTLFDATGAILGGTRPEPTPGFATAAPLALAPAVLANLVSETALTHVGVHSTDNSTPIEGIGSFDATWDFLRLSSPQFVDGPVVDNVGPTAVVTLAAPDSESDPIVATVVYNDASDIDPASIDATDLTLAGPGGAGAITLISFVEATNTAVYSIAAPAVGWAEGDYTATVASNEVSDLADTPNLNVGGETADITLNFEDEPVVEYTPGDVIRAVNVGGPAIALDPILGIALEADDATILVPAGQIYVDGAAGSDPGVAANLAGSALATERFATTLTLNMANPDGSPLASGTYFVEIHFAELFQTLADKRIFDVSIEGTQADDNLDLVAEVGASQPFVISQAVEVTDGFATVILDASAAAGGLDNAKIGALVIRQALPVSADVPVSLTGPGEVVENADGTAQGDDQDLTFTLTAADPAFTGTLDLTLEVDGTSTPLTGVAFTDGVATITVPVPTDTRWNDSESVSVTLLSVETSGYAVDTAAASATATVTEDDPADSYDLDGVGVADPVVVGDLSDDRLAPSDIGTMQLGDNILYATQQGDDAPGGRDRDYITFEVPEGTVMTQLILDGYVTEENTASGFMGLQAGSVVTVDPVTGAPDTGTDGLIAGIIYGLGTGPVGSDLLVDLAAGGSVDPRQPEPYPGFDLPLEAGTYTLWLNQGGPSTSVTLRAVIETAPVPEFVLSIADAATVAEADGATLDFALTIDVPFTGDIQVTYDTDTATGLAQTVSFVAGAGTLSIPVIDDAVDDGDDTVSVTLTAATDLSTNATPVVLGTAAAEGIVTEDDAIDPADIDGDGILNIDDPFAYDGTNGDAKVLAANGSFRQDFDVDTTDPFSAEAGFSGIMVNPAFTPGGDLTTDPYGDRTSEATTLVESGVFKTQSSIQDSFAAAGNVTNTNTLKDNYQSAVDVSGVESFSLEGKANNVFAEVFDGGIPTQYASYGITLGAGGVDDFVKLVVGGIGGTAAAKELRVEIGHNNSLVGGATAVTLASAGIDKVTQATIASVVFRVDVDVSAPTEISAGTLTGVVTFLDAAGEEIGTITTIARDIDPAGSLAAAIAGENPLTGGDGGLAYGVSITHYNTAANQFTGEWDYLEISNTTLNEAPTVAAEILDQTPAEDALYSFAIPAGTFADDAGESALTLTATLADDSDLPSWLTFDGTSFSGTPLQADVDAGAITVKVTATDAQGESVSDEFTLTPQNVNDAPTINGTLEAVETTVGAATTVDLSALTLADEDGDTPTLVALSQGGTPLPAGITLVGTSLEVADTTAAGVYIIDVFANDAQVNSNTPVSVTVTVGAPLNEVPTVAAEILDQTPAEDALYSFAIPAGTFADDAGESALTLTATLADDSDLPSWLTFDGTSFSGTPLQADVDAGAITVKVTATDAQGESVSDEFTLTPQNVNDAPTINGTLEAVETTVGAATTVDLSALTLADEDGDTPTLVALSQGGTPLPAGITLVGTSLEVADTTAAGVYIIDVFANDAQVNSNTPVSVTVTVGAPPVTGDPIRIEAEDFTSSAVYAPQSVGSASGDEVIFLPRNGAAGSATYDLAAKGVAPGTYDIEVVYYDENDGVSIVDLTLDGTPVGSITFDEDTPSNAASSLNIRSQTFFGVTVGAAGVLVLDGMSDAGEFARIDYIEFTPVEGGVDENTAPFAPFDLPDASRVQNADFDFDAGALFADAEEDALSFAATTTTADGGVLVGNLPEGVTFDTATGVFGGAPSAPGSYEITVTASDGTLPSTPETFTLTVLESNDAPVLDALIADQTVRAGDPVNFNVAGSFSDPDSDDLIYVVAGDLPPGVTFDEVTGTFSGTLDASAPARSYQVTVTATDTTGSNTGVSDTFLFNVTGSGVDTRPTVRLEAEDGDLVDGFFIEKGERIRLLADDEGTATYDLSAIDPGDYLIRVAYWDENDGESTIGVSVASDGGASFSDGFTLDEDTPSNAASSQNFREKTLDGTLSLGTNGLLTLTGQSAGNGSDWEFVRVDWIELIPVGGGGTGNFAPSEAGDGIPDTTVGLGAISIDTAAAFADPEEDMLTYAKVSGPDWVSVNSVTGEITGTPPAAGGYDITVSAEDAANNPGILATSDFTLTVEVSDNVAPTADAIILDAVDETAAPVSIDLLVDANAEDGDGDALGVEGVTVKDADGNDVAFTLDGTSLSIDPAQFAALDGDESAMVTVSYDITDGKGGVTPNFATLTVDGVDDPSVPTVSIAGTPTAVESGDVDTQTTLVFDLAYTGGANETRVVTYTVNGDARTATVTFTDGAGALAVSVDNDDLADGTDDITVVLTGIGDNVTDMVDIAARTATGTVTEDDFAPVAVADTPSTAQGAPVTFDPAANDTDADGGALTVTEIDTGATTGGTVTLNDNGTVTVTPEAGFTGQIAFGYTVADSAGNLDAAGSAAVTVTGGVDTRPTVRIEAEDGLLSGGFLVEKGTVLDGELGLVAAAVGTGDYAGLAADLSKTLVTGGVGNAGDNVVLAGATGQGTGRGGDDVVIGGVGANLLIGGGGDDIMFGGSGADDFQFLGYLVTGPERDTVMDLDFAGGDRLVLAGYQSGVFSAAAKGAGLNVFSGGASAVVSSDEGLARLAALSGNVTLETDAGSGSMTLGITQGGILQEINLIVDYGPPRIRTSGDGTAVYDLSGVAVGDYLVRIGYWDENDGASSVGVTMSSASAGTFSDTLALDEATQSNRFSAQNYRETTLDGAFKLGANGLLTLTGLAQGSEIVRIDYIELIPTGAPAGNAAPTAVTLTPVIAGIAEDTLAATKVADIAVTDDGQGANTFALTGEDAGLFEIVGNELFLKAGQTLDAIANPTLDVAVTVNDASVGADPDAVSALLSIPVSEADAPPSVSVGVGSSTIEGDPAAATLTLSETSDQPITVTLVLSSGLRSDPATIGAAAGGGDLAFNAAGLATLDVTIPTGSLSVDVPFSIFQDDLDEADFETYEIAITAANVGGSIDGAAEQVAFNPTPAEGGVLDDDAPVTADDLAPDGDLDGDGVLNNVDPDVDGDGTANADDPFAYDAGNGMTLAAGETRTFDFDIDGTIFQNGLTGFLQGTTNGGAFNEDTGANSVSGGILTVNPVTGGDTGVANNPQDDAVVGVRNGTFVAKAVVLNPWVGAAPNPGGFDQLGLVMGLDSADMIKLVFGQTGQQVEFQKQQADVGTKYGGSTGGGNSNFNLSTIGQSLDSFARAEITLEVVSTNAATASVTGTIVFLADDGTVLATQGMGTAPIGGALAAALADPAIAVAVGFTHADATTAPGFIARLDSLTITEGDGSVPSVDTDAPTAAITLTNPVDATAPLLVSVTLDDASGIDTTTLGDADLELLLGGFPVAADVSYLGFADGVATYEIAASPLGWTNGQQVAVTLLAGEVADQATPSNTNAATSESITLDIGGGSTGGGEDEVVFRINAGGSFVAATDGGPDWAGDSITNPNVYLAVTDNRNDTGGTAVSTFDGVPSAVFAEARSSDFAFSYDIPTEVLENGENYEVRLYFAEIFTGAQGGDFRNFDATVEGFVPAAFNNIDPGALFGANAGVLTTQVKVTDGTLNIGFTQDVVENPIISAIEIVKLSTDVENPEPPVDPGNALEAFAAQDDIVKNATYGAGATGSAVLEIMTGDNNIQSSNFGANSFEVTNTGDKKISAIFIDVSSALYQDSVFDPDGKGGDNASKAWQINSAGDTGAFINTGYFLPGVDPIPNTGTGANASGGASNGGFKGAMVKFNANSSGGFGLGETVGFSGDMDPNSIAGMAKADVDGTAILSWDVGGISGHELIGSLFTVLFDDGTTASGQLASDGSSAGSHALATQGAAPAAAPGIAVNGVLPGQNGTYGGTLPTITVTGNPGDKVQITMTKGFNPVVETDNGIADLVEARLARYDFKANNAFDAQTKIVTIGADGTFDASTLFDYDDAINNNVGSGTFAGDDVAQIGFVATKVQDGGAQLPIGPTTAPIYLTNVGGPVTGDPTGGTGGEGYFEIIGSGNNARFKIQIEDENANGGTNPPGNWTYVDGDGADGKQSGTQGGHYYWGSEADSVGLNGPQSNSFLNYEIFIPDGEEGVYNLRVRASRDTGEPSDQRNDVWVRIDDDAEALQVNPTNSVSSNGFVKVFGGGTNSWGFAGSIDSVLEEDPNFSATFNLDAGLHTITLAGRSQGFHIDFFELYKGGAPSTNASNSTFIEGEPGDGGGTGGGGTGSGGELRKAIVAGSDDTDQNADAGTVNLTKADMELGDGGRDIGLRFTDLDLESLEGVDILDAYIEFTARSGSSGAVSATVKLEDSLNPATFSAASGPADRDTFDFTADWTDSSVPTAGSKFRTDDLSDLIEAFVASRNAELGTDDDLAFVIEDVSGVRKALSFEGSAAAELVLILPDDTILG